MQNIEYLMDKPPCPIDEVTEWLNNKAAEGYRLIHVTAEGYIFERPVYDTRPLPPLDRLNPEKERGFLDLLFARDSH